MRKQVKSSLMSVFSAVVCFALVLCSFTSASGQEGPVSGDSVPLIIDPMLSTFRIAPKKHPDLPRPAAITVRINYMPNGSTGTWGDPCESWPVDAQAAFGYAAGIWAGYLNSAIPIDIEACWTSMPNPSVLGHGGPVGYWAVDGALYPSALANSLTGEELNDNYYGRTNYPEIAVAFNKNFSWYFGTDGSPGANVDFASVVLHEICHGLGFLGSMDVDDGNSSNSAECNGTAGVGCWGFGGMPLAFDLFAVNGAGQSLIDTGVYLNPSAALGTALTSNNVYFDGANARSANGNADAKLYAPATWNPGSSYSHLDEVFNGTPNALMTWSLSYGESDHDPGPVTLGILKDIGWSVAGSCTYSINPQSSSFDLNGGSSSVNVTADTGCSWTAVSNDTSWIHITSPSSGTGGGTAGYSVDAYTGLGTRSGTMTIAGRTFTVEQTGCSYTLSPGQQTFTSGNASSQTFLVTTAGICPWSASTVLGWVAVNSGRGTGSGTVNYSVASNPSVAPRTGNINVADRTFTVIQAGVAPVADFSASSTSGNVPYGVTFGDLSSNSPTSWYWDFGDGGTSTLQNPSHTYNTTTNGPFTVSLTVTNQNGSDTKTVSGYIHVGACGSQPVRYTGSHYPSYDSAIGAAYTDAADVDELDIQAVDFGGDVAFSLNKTVALKGGFDCSYSATRIPDTVIKGTVTIGGGTVIFDAVVIK